MTPAPHESWDYLVDKVKQYCYIDSAAKDGQETPSQYASRAIEGFREIGRKFLEQRILSERSRIIGVVKEILEDNRGETLWGDEASNEVMKVSLDQFILVVNEALDSHLREPLHE